MNDLKVEVVPTGNELEVASLIDGVSIKRRFNARCPVIHLPSSVYQCHLGGHSRHHNSIAAASVV